MKWLPSKLVLSSGEEFPGFSPPWQDGAYFGEAVFATGMTGYVESLSDPSFAGQILVCTYPLIGNYGVPSADKFESQKMQVAGLVVANYSETYSHHDAVQSLAEWCKASGVPAIQEGDTRTITKRNMIHNDATPHMEVDPETYEVRADGELLTCEPAKTLPLAQRYFLF